MPSRYWLDGISGAAEIRCLPEACRCCICAAGRLHCTRAVPACGIALLSPTWAVDAMRRRALCLAYAATVASALPRPRRATTLRALRVRGGGPVDGALDKVRDLTTTPAGSVAFVSIYMAMELCGLPSVPLAAAAGVAYPTKVALAVVLASSVTAACVAYYVGRTRLRPRLDKRISKDRRLRAVAAAVRDEGFAILLVEDGADAAGDQLPVRRDGAEIPGLFFQYPTWATCRARSARCSRPRARR